MWEGRLDFMEWLLGWINSFEAGGVFAEAGGIGFEAFGELLDVVDIVGNVLLITIAIDIITISDDGFEEGIDADVFV